MEVDAPLAPAPDDGALALQAAAEDRPDGKGVPGQPHRPLTAR